MIRMPQLLNKGGCFCEKSIHSRIEKDEQYTELAALFKTTLADETRLRIMFAISEKELCVQELTVVLNVSSLVSHQMKTLKFMKLVKQRREGKNVYYSLDDEHVLQILEIALEYRKHN